MELMKGESLEGSVHTPMYNPHILPLNVVLLSNADFYYYPYAPKYFV